VGWGDLGIQVGRHANDLNHEVDRLLGMSRPGLREAAKQ